MKLKEGMYVRYKYHNEQKIGKVDFIIYNEFADENFIGLTNNEGIFEGKILKASFNIIDLIKVGDYVNGQQVKQILKGDGYYYLFNDCYDGITSHIIAGKDVDGYTKPIESIVTKEQFEACKYVVERDK